MFQLAFPGPPSSEPPRRLGAAASESAAAAELLRAGLASGDTPPRSRPPDQSCITRQSRAPCMTALGAVCVSRSLFRESSEGMFGGEEEYQCHAAAGTRSQQALPKQCKHGRDDPQERAAGQKRSYLRARATRKRGPLGEEGQITKRRRPSVTRRGVPAAARH